MEIKRLDGNSLDKLLIFPGDWHTLKKFQPVLIKILYYHAGLKELAQKPGFKGETLTSLERCSNFKRTHSFLLQAWQSYTGACLLPFLKQTQGYPKSPLTKQYLSLTYFSNYIPSSVIKKPFTSFLSMYTSKQNWMTCGSFGTLLYLWRV